MTTSLLDYLYATPYTPIAPSDRSGDLLGWSRLRQKLQRELFPAFTVLTPRRTSAEMLLLYLKILNDEGLRKSDTFKWNWDVGAEFRISIKKPELRGLRP